MKYKVGDFVTIRKDLQVGEVERPKTDSGTFWTVNVNREMAEMRGRRVKITRVVDYANRYEVEGSVWFWCDTMFESTDEQKIVITTDGNETLARLYNGKTVVKSATAKCHPDDTFDFKEGARIAMERLMETLNLGSEAVEKPTADEVKPEQKWKVVDRPAKVGDYIRLVESPLMFTFNREGDILKVDGVDWNVYVLGKNHERDCPDTRGVGAEHKWHYMVEEYEVVEPVFESDKAEESKPTYYNGKVKCVKSPYPWFTVGKVYDVVDGKFTDDRNTVYPKMGEPYKDEEDIRHAGCLHLTGDPRHNPRNEFVPCVEETPAPEVSENTKWRVVHRKPVVGDYIRLKTNGGYHIAARGDILMVDGVESSNLVFVYGRNHKRNPHGDNYNDPLNYFLGSECEIVEPVTEQTNDKPEDTAKNKYAFNVGDRVKHKRLGVGTVICIDHDACFGVEFDNYDGGHNCEGIRLACGKTGTRGTSWWCYARELTIVDENKDETKIAFVPRLISILAGTNYGTIGTPTNYKDANGIPLCVGDTVDLYDEYNKHHGESPVTQYEGKVFIMGIKMSCNDKSGTTGSWRIIKKRSFEEVKDGGNVGHIEYVKTERKS